MSFARRPLLRRLLPLLLLILLSLLPLLALVHKNDLGRWDVARSAMAAPDEFSYLLLADSLLHGQGVHLASTIGRDTFYPPGYPLLLALFSVPAGKLTLFGAHLLNALLLCAGVPLAYAVARQLLRRLNGPLHRRYRLSEEGLRWLALLCAATFAVNWHVLEGALFVFSEPAFTLATLAWITLALRWPDWPASPRRALPIALLAVAAYTIRGAGLVCLATTLLYAGLSLLQQRRAVRGRVVSLLLILLLAGAAKYATRYTDNAPNAYSHQLVNGLTDGGRFSFARPRDYRPLLLHTADLAASHLDDLAQAFTPIPRVFPDLGPLSFIGRVLALLALTSWLVQLVRRRSGTRFLDFYLLLYFGLYLLWPFNMARFWTPVLPFLLPYAAHAARALAGAATPARRQFVQAGPVLLLALLLVLHGEELYLHLPPYQRRLNYVSDALASAATIVRQRSPDPRQTFLCVEGGDEYFIFAWYLAHPPGGAAGDTGLRPRAPREGERIESLLVRTLADAAQVPQAQVFVASYFDESLFQEVFANLRRDDPELMSRYAIVKIYQKGIEVNLWELRPIAATTR